ncbi:MAG TPA: hypothetical protein VFX28_04195, partial [Methylomirabilota bacterium]|nr:hypothetical protein [Methylomirabilota bacterium]
EPDRRPVYHRLLREGFPAGHAADDGAALHFVDRALHACVTARPGATGYRVECRDGEVVETPLAATTLDSSREALEP